MKMLTRNFKVKMVAAFVQETAKWPCGCLSFYTSDDFMTLSQVRRSLERRRHL